MIRVCTLPVAVVALLLVFSLSARATTPADGAIDGLWTCRLQVRQALRGELRIARRAQGFTATFQGRSVPAAAAGDSIRFALADTAGRFRGVWGNDRSQIDGFWVQPVGPLYDAGDPGSEPLATPVTLRRSGADEWDGRIEGPDDHLSFGLRVFRGDDGTRIAAFRNPEANFRGGASWFRVRLDADSVWFTARPDTTLPEIRLAAARLRSPERMRLAWPELGVVLELHRPTPLEQEGLRPRPPADSAYVYRAPAATRDGWAVARARDTGMDEAALAGVVQRLARGDPFARRPSLVHSLLVAHAGRLVLDEYFFGWTRETPHDVRSAGKTFGSVLLGAEMHRGASFLPDMYSDPSALSPDTPLYEVVRDRGPFANPDRRKYLITLDHLMTHRSGLAADDNDEASPGGEDAMQSQRAQPDWWKYELDLPMKYEPGTHYAYASGAINLVGAALATATGAWLPALFDRDIARPLGFGVYHWNLMANGEGYLGGGAFLRPRDLLKLGQVFLDGGTWKGRRIVDSSWVARSTTPQAEISPATTGLDSLTFSQFYAPGMDGYAWHLRAYESQGRSYRAFEAVGNGGQLLIVVPELDLAVVITGGNYGQGGIWNRWRKEIVTDAILPAIRSAGR